MVDAEHAPALYHHCVTAYNEMLVRSKDERGERLYEGHLTRLFEDELGYSSPYYSHITRKLKAMDCVRMLKRGGGGGSSMSVWLLIQQPTLELYENTPPDEGYDSRGIAGGYEQLRWSINQLSARILVLEKLLGVVSAEDPEQESEAS